MALDIPYCLLDRASEKCPVLEFCQVSSEDESTFVRCAIKTPSLAEDPVPSYSAVSWCWGNWSERATIAIDGQEVSVPKNAEVVLRYLHGQVSPLEPASEQHLETEMRHQIWIDAICINQRDTTERS